MDLRIVVLVGEPGSGKSTVADGLIALRPELYRTLISNTTREKRSTDKPADFRYVTRGKIREWEKNEELAWPVAEAAGIFYATRLEDIRAALRDKEHIYLSILVPETAETFYRLYPENVLPLRVHTNLKLLPERLRQRGTDPADAERRLAEVDRWRRAFEAGVVPYQAIENNGSAKEAIEAADRLIQGHLKS